MHEGISLGFSCKRVCMQLWEIVVGIVITGLVTWLAYRIEHT